MKKRAMCWLVIFLFGLTMLFSLPVPVKADGDFVAEEKPVLNSSGIYEIGDAEQLLFLSQNFGSADCPQNGHYKLTADIDMAEITNYKPFGRFYGTFDGNFKTISNLRIDSTSGTVGMFTYVGDNNVQAVVKNLALTNAYVKGGATVGTITGMLFGTIENCYVTGEVDGSGLSLGGIAGRIPEDTSGTVAEPEPGTEANPTIRNCYSVVVVRQLGSGDSQGEISGRVLNPRTTIENCYAAGVVYGDFRVGGLVGDLRTGILKNSVAATPYLSADRELGSAAGRVQPEPSKPSYPTASADNILSYDKIKKEGTASGKSFDGTPKTADELYEQATYEALGWDFSNTWEMISYTDGGKTYRSPVLKGFAHQEFTFDFEDYLSSVAVTASAAEITSDSITITAQAQDSENPETTISGYCMIQSTKKPTSDQKVWEKTASKTFRNLSPSTQYIFWIRAKTEEGKESGWISLTQFTKYVVSTDTMPKNISNTITQDPETSASFVWTTDNIELNDSTVEIVKKEDSGTLPSVKQKLFRGTNTVKEVHMTTNELVNDGIRNSHHVNVTGLSPDTEYVYRVGDAHEDAWSQCGSFKTAPASSDSLKFTYFSDPQVQTSSKAAAATFATIQRMFPDQAFTYSSGDETEKGYSNGEMDTLFRAGQNLFLSTTFVGALGNHDRSDYIQDYFNLPATVLPCVYSFDYGPAHFSVLNTEYYSGENLDKQIEWLRSDVRGSDKKWHLVLLHKSLYAATDHVDDDDINELRVKLVPVLQELKIDAVLMGHDHSFSRGFVLNGSNARPLKLSDGDTEIFAKPDAPLYIVNGTAGDSKWYNKIHYDSAQCHVSADYEFVDKTSADYENTIKEQSFSSVQIDGDVLSLDTYFLKFNPDHPDGYEKAPYLYDSIQISKSDLPIVESISDQTIEIGKTLTATVQALDPDGAALTYRAEDLPHGAQFDPQTHRFTWTPAQAGTYRVRFLVSNAHGSTERDMAITVKQPVSSNQGTSSGSLSQNESSVSGSGTGSSSTDSNGGLQNPHTGVGQNLVLVIALFAAASPIGVLALKNKRT